MATAMTLRLQLLLLQALIVFVTTAATGLVAGTLQERSIRDAYQDRMQAVALSVARLPAITEAFESDAPEEVIQPIAEVIRRASDVTYVVVTDADGVRYSHPDRDRIGERVSTDPSVPLSGEVYVGTQTGTLGTSWRVKVPIYAADQQTVIGTASVGILESQLTAEFLGNLIWLVLAMVGSAVLGVLGAAWVTAIVRRRIYRLEPEEIASLVQNRETTLHRLSEGVVVVDERGTVTLVNDAAQRLLDADASELIGEPAAEVLPEALVDVLDRGEPEGQLVLAGERVLIARSTGTRLAGSSVEATLLLRDHTELHALLRSMDGAQSITHGLRAQAHEFANTMHVVSGLLEIGLVAEARAFIARSTPGGSIGLPGGATVLGDAELTALLSVKAAQAREIGIDLEVALDDAAEGGEVGRAFEGDLLTVVGNLVDNAIEACAMGDRIRLEVRLDRDGADAGAGSGGDRGASRRTSAPAVHLIVDDSGPGIPADRRELVFAEGVSTKEAGAAAEGQDERGGPAGSNGHQRRGIGLALVRRVVARRGGRVRISESPFGGARIALVLPVPLPVPVDAAVASASSRDAVTR